MQPEMIMNTIIVQIRIENDGIGNLEALKQRHELESKINNALRNLNATVDGGQAGSGSMEIFIIEVEDIDFCLDVIINFLKDSDLERDYKVVWLPEEKLDGNPYTKWNIAFASDKSTMFSFNAWHFDG